MARSYSGFMGGTASVYVGDVNLAVRFYSEALQLRLITQIGDEWAEFDAGNGFVIGLHRAQPPTTVSAGTAGAINIELRVPEDVPFDEVVAQLKGRGVTFLTPVVDYPHVRLATFKDLDGNALILAQNRTN